MCKRLELILKNLYNLRYPIELKKSSKISVNKVPISGSNCDSSDDNLYDLRKGTLIRDLRIKISSNYLPRFSCACHKINIAVRKAIASHDKLCNILRELNIKNKVIRRSIKLSKIFRKKKSKLRLENLTRWSSAYLMLESVRKAIKRKAFDKTDKNRKCPVSLRLIETYLQILKPAYQMTINFQSNHSSIADLLVSLKRAIFTWENMNVIGDEKYLCDLLVHFIKNKFDYELNSDVYKVIILFILNI